MSGKPPGDGVSGKLMTRDRTWVARSAAGSSSELYGPCAELFAGARFALSRKRPSAGAAQTRAPGEDCAVATDDVLGMHEMPSPSGRHLVFQSSVLVCFALFAAMLVGACGRRAAAGGGAQRRNSENVLGPSLLDPRRRNDRPRAGRPGLASQRDGRDATRRTSIRSTGAPAHRDAPGDAGDRAWPRAAAGRSAGSRRLRRPCRSVSASA